MTRLKSALYRSLSFAIFTARCRFSPTDLKSLLMFFINVVLGRPTGLLIGFIHSNKVSFAGAPSGRRHIWPKSVRRRSLQVSDHGLVLVIL